MPHPDCQVLFAGKSKTSLEIEYLQADFQLTESTFEQFLKYFNF